MTEYENIIGLVSIVAIAALSATGGQVNDLLNSVRDSLCGAGGGGDECADIPSVGADNSSADSVQRSKAGPTQVLPALRSEGDEPPFCLTSLVSRVLESVDAGCDPDSKAAQQSLENAVVAVDGFWTGHNNSWGTGSGGVTVTDYPNHDLYINGEYAGHDFHDMAGRYVFYDMRLDKTAVDGYGYFYLTAHSIDYTDTFRLSVRCQLEPQSKGGVPTEYYCLDQASSIGPHCRP